MLFPDDEIAQVATNGEYKRLVTPYCDTSDRFRFKGPNDYSKQFAHIYASRLAQMRKLLTVIVQEKWGKSTNFNRKFINRVFYLTRLYIWLIGKKYPLKRMADLREDNPEKCILIGTLFKHQPLKPSILRELSEETQLAPQPARDNYVDDTDKLILEDELQRIRLLGKIDVHTIVTGVVCAVLGKAQLF